MPADLKIDHYEPNTEGLYIVQLIGPPYQEWINTLKGNGVQIYWSVPPDNYIVRMNSNIEGTVRNLWFVQWVGIYQPAYKIEPNITTPKIVVQVWNGSTSNETIKALRSLGTVEDVSYASSDDEYEVRMLFDNSNLTAIANLPDVMLIAEFNYNITALNNSNNVPHPLDIGVAVVLIVITMIFSYGFIRHSKRKRDKKMVNEDQISQKEAEK